MFKKKSIILIFGIVILISLASAGSFGYDNLNIPSLRPEVVTGGGNVTNLDDLADVNASSPANDEVLTWSDTFSKWIAKSISGIPKWIIDSNYNYFYNDTSTLYFNETKLNETIDIRSGVGGAQEFLIDITPTNGNFTYTTPLEYTNNIISFIINSTTSSTTFYFDANETNSGTMLDTSRKQHTGEWYITKNVACTDDNITMRIIDASVDELFTLKFTYN